MANPTAPLDSSGAKMGFGIALVGAADEPAWLRIVDPAVVADETTKSGAALVSPQPTATGGLSTFNGTSSDGATAVTNSAQAVKASAGQVYGWYIHNPNDETSYVNLYNTASGSVTVGTTAPLFQIELAAGQGANLIGAHGIAFGTAISVSATKTAGSSTAPDTAMEVVLFYK